MQKNDFLFHRSYVAPSGNKLYVISKDFISQSDIQTLKSACSAREDESLSKSQFSQSLYSLQLKKKKAKHLLVNRNQNCILI